MDLIILKDLNKIKEIVIEHLKQLETNMLQAIVYDPDGNEIKIDDNFKRIRVKEILNGLNIESGDAEMIKRLNVRALLRKLNQIVVLRKRNTRRRIREEIGEYLMTLEERIERQSKKYPAEEYEDMIEGEESILPRRRYEGEKYKIQIELLKLQEWIVENDEKIVIVFEGRDAAGKGSTIKRFIEYLNPKHFRVVALGIPTEEEKNNWFQRYERHLPNKGEIVFFDRSWYNRAVVEPAMGYCSEYQYNHFMENVIDWEESLLNKGFKVFKLWFSISREKQMDRFERRKGHPLKYWKYSPNDAMALDAFDRIGELKNKMFHETSTPDLPWVIVNSEDKKVARLNAMRYILSEIDYKDKDDKQTSWFPEVINPLD